MANSLPPASGSAKEHSDHCLQMIRDTIIKNGPLSFAQYMQLALYQEGLGYYVAGAEKLGKSGDFTTAPELSPLFSQCLANQCQQVLNDIGGDILELGPGSGIMAATIMNTLAKKNCLPKHYYLLELSPDLTSRQQQLLKKQCSNYYDRFIWLSQWPSEPLTGVVLANEVLDAMPVDIFEWHDDTIQACQIGLDEQSQLTWTTAPANESLTQAVTDLNQSFQPGYRSEINSQLPGWLNGLSDSLQRGVVLLIDYGFPAHEYYHPDRSQGTLMCHYRHIAHTDPFIYPGIQDITAHVDFTAVALLAENAGFSVMGFTPQAYFLINCGIDQLIPLNANTEEYFKHAQAIKQLTLPHEMGELFKVIALGKSYEEPLMGFSHFDQRGRLLPMEE